MMDAGVLYIRQELLVLYLLLDEKGAIALRYTIHLLNPLGKKKGSFACPDSSHTKHTMPHSCGQFIIR